MDEIALPLFEEDRYSRRSFLHLLGVGALTACESPREAILPYVIQPPGVQPGKPQFYATAMTIDGHATGLLVESYTGRPTKIEGNPAHPASLGATGLLHQASIFDLYAPGRARMPTRRAGPASFDELQRLFGVDPRDPAPAPRDGRGLHFVLEPTSSPLVISLIERTRARYPGAQFHFHAALHAPAVPEASRLALGQVLSNQYRFDRAAVVLAIDSDFLGNGPFGARWAHDFAAGRRVRQANDPMNRLYVVEADLTITGTCADHRLRARPSEIPLVFAAVAEALLRQSQGLAPGLRALLPQQLPQAAWAEAVARDLLRNRGRSLVIAGDRQPLETHLLCHALNALLGNVGQTLFYTQPAIYEAGQPSHGLGPLIAALDAQQVQTLVLLEVDPARDAFADQRFAERLAGVQQSICVSMLQTETARGCTWFLPGLHWLEQWGDARAYDGTLGLQQPLIRPLFGGVSTPDLLGVFAGAGDNAYGLLRASYGGQAGAAPDASWSVMLQRGLAEGTAFAEVQTALQPGALQAAFEAIGSRAAAAGGSAGGSAAAAAQGLELSFRPDPKLYDGRFGNNDWLLELPDPVQRLSWDNAAEMAPATAARLGVVDGDLIDLRYGERSLRIPALVVRGIAPETISIALGWGQIRGREIVGTDAFPLRTSDSPWRLEGVEAVRVLARGAPGSGLENARVDLASGQPHLDEHERPILIGTTLAHFRSDPAFAQPHDEPQPSLYPNAWPKKGPQWGMSIDLTTCTGCATCVIACQAENNIPIVGKVGVARGRAMHWLRIDRYLQGAGEDTLQLLPQPMLCQHCEQAPCEYVCPVNATVHSPDGLNEMIYNRCIGTRFCSNNCPYKVRRFNFFEYNSDLAETSKMQKNPNVTVRARGVMEKCTYCVQRIRSVEIEARIERRPIREGEVKTACQAACPTGAIVFGLVSEPQSAVSLLHAAPQSYGVLEQELGTAPRTRYLAHLRNANEEIEV